MVRPSDDGVHIEAPLAQTGARVEYRSATLGGWARAEVTAINVADGTVSVHTLGCGVRPL